jgi:DEAD/DEAH box helicase domain-containing protein
MNIDQIIDVLRSNEHFMNNITKWETIAPKEGIYGDIPNYIDKRLINALNRKNIFRLYKHQNEAIDYITRGNDTVIVTPTASGKTLCYNIPVINSFLKDSTSRAIYLFPTKALSQDQVHELVNINELIGGGLKVYTFDGDTPVNARKAIRNVGNIVVTNPDMLHQGILPNHTKWIKMFSNLKYVVIDEMHQYRGIFGSHVANVIRRLKRIASFYGSKPIFILSSATIRNPKELAENLIEESVAIVTKNCAPSGEKHYILYNPPVINKELGIRSSYIKQTTKIAEEFLRDEIKTIIFVRTRTAVEILTTYLKEKARKLHKNPELVQGYRGGYLPLERRNIEKGLKNNSIKTVISTNALELGIDIGGLDVSITAGYPGTITSFLQQSGRAGRGVTTAISIMVASSAPIDQFMINHPEYFFGNSPELGVINANNLIILINHIKCAAFELPFKDNEIFGVDTTDEILKYLENNGILHHSEGSV